MTCKNWYKRFESLILKTEEARVPANFKNLRMKDCGIYFGIKTQLEEKTNLLYSSELYSKLHNSCALRNKF